MSGDGVRPQSEHPISNLLEDVARGHTAFASGSAAALTASLAAALVSMGARASRPAWPDAAGAIAHAETLRSRLFPLITSDAHAYHEARALLARTGRDRDRRGASVSPGTPPLGNAEERNRQLANVLSTAAIEPVLIAEAAADVAQLATVVAAEGSADHRADAVNAAILAEAAACAAAHLVEINLGVGPDDDLSVRAGEAAAAAHAARARAVTVS